MILRVGCGGVATVHASDTSTSVQIMTSSVILKCATLGVLKTLPQRLRRSINLFRNHFMDIHDAVCLVMDLSCLLLHHLLVKTGAQMEVLIGSRFPEDWCRVKGRGTG